MKKIAARSTQYPVMADFFASFNDWVIDTLTGVKATFGSTVALAVDPAEPGLTGPAANTVTLECIPLPVGAVITGGELIVETAFVGPTVATVSLGILGSLTALLSAADLKTVGRTALALTSPLLSNAAGTNLRLTVAYTVANATAGKFRLRVLYTVDGKANEVQIG